MCIKFYSIRAPHSLIVSVKPTGPGAVNHNASYSPSTIKPAKPINAQAKIQAAAACSGPVTGNPSGFWMDQEDHTGNARGYAPFLVR